MFTIPWSLLPSLTSKRHREHRSQLLEKDVSEKQIAKRTAASILIQVLGQTAPVRSKDPEQWQTLYDFVSHWDEEGLLPCTRPCLACEAVFSRDVKQYFSLINIRPTSHCAGTMVMLNIFESFGTSEWPAARMHQHLGDYRSFTLQFKVNSRRNIEVDVLHKHKDWPAKSIFNRKHELLHYPDKTVPEGHKDLARFYDPLRVNVDLFREWIHICDTEHGGECHSTDLPPPDHSLLLIDVENRCLVRASSKSIYVALSYVWGLTINLRTTLMNLSTHMTPGGISFEYHRGIPNTILDAIQMTQLLGLKYLWVDSLCIVQDDMRTKNIHLNSMASIYANAYLTLIAAEGADANHGLSGIPGGSRSRNIERIIVETPSGQGSLLSPVEPQWPESSFWNQRGWTFQELLFSKRILIMNGGLVHWHCSTSHFEEDKIRGASNSSDKKNSIFITRTILNPDNTTTSPLHTWAGLVEKFNRRSLTYDEDVVGAFTSITTLMQHSSFPSGITHGHPTASLLPSLLWLPAGPLRRRIPSSQSPTDTVLPSWSWQGWQGPIDCRLWSTSPIFHPSKTYPSPLLPSSSPSVLTLKTHTMTLSIGQTACHKSSLLSFHLHPSLFPFSPATGFILTQADHRAKLQDYGGECRVAVVNEGRMANRFVDEYLHVPGRDRDGWEEVWVVIWIVKRRGGGWRRWGIGALVKGEGELGWGEEVVELH
ncbi:HET-domain-containing protein [Aaosphaeria arxii CBS 175.79]|uniref:HET-domain-containing protein n=1 Tax=Aaosphaeria arxii CBS 175.79 TaxID=1450172 RepID=A0A6A5XC92_9PLEO|nr:HET-domain-containing protein [Aaosphaeria arxii CBS 175.79]KAF2010427.1 HET-domain-containing protein [Aaosphaeria arxii CBS 175.79]